VCCVRWENRRYNTELIEQVQKVPGGKGSLSSAFSNPGKSQTPVRNYKKLAEGLIGNAGPSLKDGEICRTREEKGIEDDRRLQRVVEKKD